MKGLNLNKLYTVFLAIVFSLSVVGMTRVHCGSAKDNSVWGGMDVNYVNEFGMSAIVLAVLAFVIFLFMIRFSEKYCCGLITRISSSAQEQNRKKIVLFWGIILFVVWIPYYLSYYPGGGIFGYINKHILY